MIELRDIPGHPGYQCGADGSVWSLKSGKQRDNQPFLRMSKMTKTNKAIVRRPDFAGGGITDDEKARMEAHAAMWSRNAMRTEPIEPDKIVPAIEGLYRAADLAVPRVVIVPSPLVMAIAGGFASAIWWARKNGKPATADAATDAATNAATDATTRRATRAATDATDATDAATDAATRLATSAATDATRLATRAATDGATFAATDVATNAATDATTRRATRAATDATDATDAATDATDDATDMSWVGAMARELSGGDEPFRQLLMNCTARWWSQYQGGNMWSAWDCYITAARDILGLQLPQHEKYQSWEQAAIHGGFRLMHPDFAMVCDFPEVLEVDAQNRPHNASGPSHRWRDGWSLYHWHGVRVPEYIIERPHEITVALIERETNAEVRRAMVEQYGSNRYLLDSGAKVVHRDAVGLLYRKDIRDDEPMVMVRVLNSTPEPDGVMSREEAIAIFGDAAKAALDAPEGSRFKEYMLRVDPECRPLMADGSKGAPQEITARNAIASTFGLRGEDYEPYFES